MHETEIIGLTIVLTLGILSQWVAWRVHLPSILLLLIAGFIAGPITGFLDPDHLFGHLLFPIVSLSVAIILFEGGLSLKLRNIKGIGAIVWNLVSIGAMVTWILVALSTYLLLEMDLEIAILFGAILVVTGPTVVTPLLRFIRPRGRIGEIAKWEGIMNDPIGAVLAVLVFKAILAGGSKEATTVLVLGLLKGGVLGVLVGLTFAGVLYFFLKNRWIPGQIQPAVALMLVFITNAVSNHFQSESGLLAVTVMGVALANQQRVTIKHIVEFKENLQVLLISSLFIILAARLNIEDVQALSWQSGVFLAILILLIRPIAVFAATNASNLNWREKLFLSWMAPRGIVAAAVASIFSLRLVEKGFPGAEQLVPLTFLVIVGTVTIYGLTIMPLARWLGIALPNPQGVLIVGSHSWARQIGLQLKEMGFRVMMIDTNRRNLTEAKLAGLETHYGNILAEKIVDDLELGGIGRLLAMTSNDEVNALAALRFMEAFDRTGVYHLPAQTKDTVKDGSVATHLQGRVLFDDHATFSFLSKCFRCGAKLTATQLSKEFSYQAFQKKLGQSKIPLFLVENSKALHIFSPDENFEPNPGDVIISMEIPEECQKEAVKAEKTAK